MVFDLQCNGLKQQRKLIGWLWFALAVMMSCEWQVTPPSRQ